MGSPINPKQAREEAGGMPRFYPVPAHLQRDMQLLAEPWSVTEERTQQLIAFFSRVSPNTQEVECLQAIQRINAALRGGMVLGYSRAVRARERDVYEHFLLVRILVELFTLEVPCPQLLNRWGMSFELRSPYGVVLDEYGRRRIRTCESEGRARVIIRQALRQVHQGSHDHSWYSSWGGWRAFRGDSCVYCLARRVEEI